MKSKKSKDTKTIDIKGSLNFEKIFKDINETEDKCGIMETHTDLSSTTDLDLNANQIKQEINLNSKNNNDILPGYHNVEVYQLTERGQNSFTMDEIYTNNLKSAEERYQKISSQPSYFSSQQYKLDCSYPFLLGSLSNQKNLLNVRGNPYVAYPYGVPAIHEEVEQEKKKNLFSFKIFGCCN